MGRASVCSSRSDLRKRRMNGMNINCKWLQRKREKIHIKYHQLCIRNAEKRDCEQLAAWWNDGTVMDHAGFPNGLGTSAAEIKKQIADDRDETRRRLIIEYNNVRIVMPIVEVIVLVLSVVFLKRQDWKKYENIIYSSWVYYSWVVFCVRDFRNIEEAGCLWLEDWKN